MQSRYAAVVSTLALVVALTGVGAQASGVFVTSKQIKNGAILSQDIHKSAVKSSDLGKSSVKSVDIGEGAVQTSDIGTGQVTPDDVTMPAPAQLQENAGDVATAEVSDSFSLVDAVGTYSKQDPGSILEVDWTGSAAAGFSGCVFQLRVDGQPSGTGTGEIYVANGSTVSVSASALFSALPAGAHQIQIWAKATIGGASSTCTVGPATAGIGQTIVVSEQVV